MTERPAHEFATRLMGPHCGGKSRKKTPNKPGADGPLGLFKHFSQHVVLLIQPRELFANDPAEALRTREQTTVAVVNGGYPSDASATAGAV